MVDRDTSIIRQTCVKAVADLCQFDPDVATNVQKAKYKELLEFFESWIRREG